MEQEDARTRNLKDRLGRIVDDPPGDDTRVLLKQRLAEETEKVKRTEVALAQSHEELRELRAALEHTVEGIARVSPELLLLSCNPAFAAQYGARPDELCGQPWRELVATADHPALDQAYLKMRQTGSAELELRCRRRDGQEAFAQLTLAEVYDAQHVFAGHFVFAKDITRRKRAEEALRRREELFRLLTDNISDVFWITGTEVGQVTYASPSYRETWGRDPAELQTNPHAWLEAVHPDDRHLFGPNSFREGKGGSKEYEFRIVRPDGSLRWLRIRGFPIRGEDGQITGVAGLCQDVTGQKELETRAQESRRDIERLIMSCDVAMLVCDREGHVQFVNPAAETLLGLSAPTIAAVPFRAALEGQERVEFSVGTAEGGDLVVEAHLLHTQWQGEVAHLVVLHDISARKRAESNLTAYAESLKRSNTELQDFAFVASHDLREPLRKVQAFGERLQRHCGPALDERGRDYLARMMSAATRMETLIDDLLTYSRVTTRAQPFAPVDLSQVLHEVLQDLEVLLEKSGGQVELGPLPTLEADPTQMRQLFQNLLGNALKFVAPGQPPRVTVAAAPEPAPGRCRILVRDNGIGFEAQYKERIFEVFQRLHGRDRYEGSGMGLAVVRKIVQRHGGSIAAESQLGQGATFVLELPLRQPHA